MAENCDLQNSYGKHPIKSFHPSLPGDFLVIFQHFPTRRFATVLFSMAGLVALRLVFGGVGPSTFSALIAEFHVDNWGFDDGIIPVLIPRDDDSALGIEGAISTVSRHIWVLQS